MVFELKNSQAMEIDEETEGWKDVLHKLPAIFPEIVYAGMVRQSSVSELCRQSDADLSGEKQSVMRHPQKS
jgi:hypothetical protein